MTNNPVGTIRRVATALVVLAVVAVAGWTVGTLAPSAVLVLG